MIQDYLDRAKISQSKLALDAGISRQLLNWHLKNPKNGWSVKNAEKVVRAIYGEIIREKVVDLVIGA